MSDQQANSEVLDSMGTRVRDAIIVGAHAAQVIGLQRLNTARAAEQAATRERAEIKDRLRAEYQAARPALRAPWSPTWWERAGTQEKAKTYELAAGWASAGDEYAAATAVHIREVGARHGVNIPEPAPAQDALAALLATDSPSADPASDLQAEEPLPPAAGDGYRYHVRDSDGALLGQGDLHVPAGASAPDAALAALSQHARAGGGDPAARAGRLFDAAYDRGPDSVPDGAQVAVYRNEGTEPAFVLRAAEAARVREERMRWRRAVISGQRKASPGEMIAALLLEQRATREELAGYQAQARRAEDPEQRAQAQSGTDAAAGRLRDLAVRHAAAQESARGRDGQFVLRAAALRRELDQGWWQTASRDEVAGLWRQVNGWPAGRGRDEAQGLLRHGIAGKYGIDIPEHTDPDRVAVLLATADKPRGDRGRSSADPSGPRRGGEQGPAIRGGDHPEPAGAVAAHGAGEQAAATAATLVDPQAARAVSVAAVTLSGTPSQRRDAGLASAQSAGPAHHAERAARVAAGVQHGR